MVHCKDAESKEGKRNSVWRTDVLAIFYCTGTDTSYAYYVRTYIKLQYVKY